MKGLVLKYFICSIIFLFFCSVIAYYIKNSIEVNEMKFKDYSSIPDDSGVKTWLPAFFPKNSKNINFHSNLDLNKFSVIFSVDNNHNKSFNSELVDLASLDGKKCIIKEDKLVNNVWCKAEINNNGDEILYLIGNYKNSNDYYLTNITRCRGSEDNCKEVLLEAKKRLCN